MLGLKLNHVKKGAPGHNSNQYVCHDIPDYLKHKSGLEPYPTVDTEIRPTIKEVLS